MFQKTLPPLVPGVDIYLKRGEEIAVVKSANNSELYYTSNLYTKFIEGVEFAGIFQKPHIPQHRNVRWMRKDAIRRV